jgi:hypothetical protein
MDGVEIVNVAVATSLPRSEPFAVTVYAAGVLDVIVTVQLKVPVPDTVAPQLVMVAPELIVVVIVAPGVNPVPVTVMTAPLGPWLGASAMAGNVTV